MNEYLIDNLKHVCNKNGVIIDKITLRDGVYIVSVKKYNEQKINKSMYEIRRIIKWGLVKFVRSTS